MGASWIERTAKVLGRWRDAGLAPTWVVAVSGGSDSVGLLRLLHRLGPALGLRLSVAHLDHGVRGDQARDDATFVAALAADLGLPFDLGRWTPPRPAHFEADARRARYAWLTEVARARGASAVAVGHTRDDQAETILHRIVRGTGPRGLAGMPARRPLDDAVTLVRPLLAVSRDEVRAFLAEVGQPYRDDASNADLSRTRARIRHDLLPRLAADYNPKVAEALVRLGELSSAADRQGRILVREIARNATVSADPAEVVLRREVLIRAPRFLRAEVLRLVWRRAGWPEAGMSAHRWRRLAGLVGAISPRTLRIGGIEVTTTGPHLILRRGPGFSAPESRGPPDVEARPLDVPGVVPWGLGRVIATLDPDAPRDETIDLDRLDAPLQVRAPRPGDRFTPLGMSGQSTPLNDFFRGRRVPRAQRGQIPLVCDQSEIVWVVGHRIADRVRLTEETRRTVGLRWENGQ